ncbi:helix-turn-helix transcriptional regulator [Parashewanella tropica]|uniref:helix-turn-helix transcriptional regulator n=1 Tax=Parashewanella tropica TaxID=2547970 RepID=UPI0010596045|nr:helix-turn-helix transcriptional regulator [Parashewanella tropica]
MSLASWIYNLIDKNKKNVEHQLPHSVESLSKMSGVSVATLYRLLSEDNTALPRQSTIEKLEKAFKVKYMSSKDKLVNESLAFSYLSSDPDSEIPQDYSEQSARNIASGGSCQICLSKQPNTSFHINPHVSKLYIESPTYDLNSFSQIYTCDDCCDAVVSALKKSYPVMITTLLHKDDCQLHLTKLVREAEVGTPITNQSLLALELGVEQSTISRIKNEKIEYIQQELAHQLHCLCARKLLQNQFTLPAFVEKKDAINELLNLLSNELDYSPTFIKEDVQLQITSEQNISCDIMVYDVTGDPLIACFVMGKDTDSQKARHKYTGLGLALGAKFVLLTETDLGVQESIRCQVAYALYESSNDISIRGIPLEQLPVFEPNF